MSPVELPDKCTGPLVAIGRACGKLYLAGEYAVVDPGGMALLAGVDRYVSVSAYHVDSPVGRIFSRYYPSEGRTFSISGQSRAGNRRIISSDWDRRDIVAAALEMAYAVVTDRGQVPQVLDLVIESGLDDEASGRKYGLGSSAAVNVAVIDAVLQAHECHVSRLELFQAAYLAATLSGQSGSGGDLASASHGGVVRYRRPELAHKPSPDCGDDLQPWAALVGTEWPNLELEHREDLPGLQLAAGWTGQPASTEAQLKRTEATQPIDSKEAFITQAAEVVQRLWQTWQDEPKEILDTWRSEFARFRELLAQYGQLKGITIETKQLATLTNIALEFSAAAKSSGAGGGDCGIALLPEEQSLIELHHAWQAADIIPLPVNLAQLNP